jgi:hypothetical protein
MVTQLMQAVPITFRIARHQEWEIQGIIAGNPEEEYAPDVNESPGNR